MKKVKSRSGRKPSPFKAANKTSVIVRDKDTRHTYKEAEPAAKLATVLKGFEEIWTLLFTSPVHLDSALSKQPPRIKSILAQIVPTLLLRPASQAEALGVGVAQDEPWSLSGKAQADWRPALLMAERMYEMMVQRPPDADPIREDFPTAMIEEWEASWGAKITRDLVNTLGREAPLSLRASRKIGAQALLNGLIQMKLPVRSEVSTLSPLGVRLAGYAAVLGSDLYAEGSFEIQDEGSQLMALFALWPDRYGAILKDRPGALQTLDTPAPPPPKDTQAWTVIDACAGAGGKSLAIADALKGKGRVYAYDTSEKKLQALRRRATRANLNNIQTVAVEQMNETKGLSKFKKTADVVLVDAPCSGWGVLRRNPDIKWRQLPDVLERMPEIQLRLLSTYSELVKPGGRLVFGVCTFRKSETTDVVQKFLKAFPQFSQNEGGYLGPGPCDGFFMQSFTREG